MKYNFLKMSAFCLLTAVSLNSCKKDKNEPGGDDQLHKIAIVTNISTGSTLTGYVGTFADFSVGSYTNSRARQTLSYPLAQIYNNDLFLSEARSGDDLIKYSRNEDGTLRESGRLTFPAGSSPNTIAFENSERAYISVVETGKISIFNPTNMTIVGEIDLTAYAIGDASPDPAVILYRNNKLYVGCYQSSDSYTSSHPAQLLIIDLANDNSITSIVDSRTTFASNPTSPGSMFFDEQGNLYVMCMASMGIIPGQKSGFLRIKNGENRFDPDYFFNVTDYSIAGIPGNTANYLHRISYSGNGIVYGIGNVPALTSNPPDYINDRNYAALKIDVVNKSIGKINIPYSNGYASCLLNYQGKVYFGMATENGVGIFSYDPATDTPSVGPVVTTQGDPSVLGAFAD